MITPTNQLFQADCDLFVNLAALNLVRFEGEGYEATAHLKFKDGGSETVQGDAAHSLRQRLTSVENGSSLFDQADAHDTLNLNSKMATLGDRDLLHVLNYFYPSFHNLISDVAKVTRKSLGHVQRVLDGDRRSAVVAAAIVEEFRRRIRMKRTGNQRQETDPANKAGRAL
jgi:hypothetical protein